MIEKQPTRVPTRSIIGNTNDQQVLTDYQARAVSIDKASADSLAYFVADNDTNNDTNSGNSVNVGDNNFKMTDKLGVELEIPNSCFYLGYRGSIAHGMYIPSDNPDSIDDIDLMGFAIGEQRHYLGLSQWGSRGTKEIKVGQYDVVLYEARKAVSLLLQGNPNIMSMLWLDEQHQLITGPIAEMLLDNRDCFVGKHVYNAFAGYAHQQMEKMESRDPTQLREYLAVTAELKFRGAHPNHKGEICPEPNRDTGELWDVMNWDVDKLLSKLRIYQKKGENIGYMGEKRKKLVLRYFYDTKNAAHLIRLLRMCIEFMKTGEMQVYRQDAMELLSIKMGEWTLSDVKTLANDLWIQAKAARDASILPNEPDYKRAEKILVSLVRQGLQL